MPEIEIVSRIQKTVSDFHIQNLTNRNIFELSGGEKQKIACASVDVLRPDLILLDEPSANLDHDSTQSLRQMIKCWKAEGRTILIAEHRINYVIDLADRMVILKNGKVANDLGKTEIRSLTDDTCEKYGLRSIKNISPLTLAKEHQENDSKELIRLTDFSYAYRGAKNILSIKEMTVPKNSVTAIVGTNGTGKTTFLECLCVIRKNKGRMISNGKVYKSKARLKEIFMVMQDPNHQLFTESVLDEVMISMPTENEEKAKQILNEVDLSDHADRHPMSLSGGQKQRTALACAIASERSILLLDETTSGLDLRHMLEVSEILKQLKEQGRTILTVTHDSEFIKNCCDNVIELSEVK